MNVGDRLKFKLFTQQICNTSILLEGDKSFYVRNVVKFDALEVEEKKSQNTIVEKQALFEQFSPLGGTKSLQEVRLH